MASDLSKYLGNKIARWLAGQAMPTAPTDIYLALYNGDPKAAGTEITTTIAAAGRIALDWTVPAANDVDNVLLTSADADFGDSDGAATLSYVAIFDAASGGNRLSSKAVPGGAIAVEVGTGIKFLAGDLSFVIGA